MPTFRRIVDAPFATVLVILGMGAVLSGPVASWLKINQVKAPIPLRQPLDQLGEASLYPYRLADEATVGAAKIVLSPEVIDALGTKDYIIWMLEDTSVEPNDPLRFAQLFVTYYTGQPDLVPHTPDACYLGRGYQPAQAHENLDLKLETPIDGIDVVPVRVLTFIKTAVHKHETISVVYTFHCNGRFVATRNRVRILVNDLSVSHAYYSKVEVSFMRATREQNLRGAAKLFARVLPLLLRNHWPDFEAVEAQACAVHKP